MEFYLNNLIINKIKFKIYRNFSEFILLNKKNNQYV